MDAAERTGRRRGSIVAQNGRGDRWDVSRAGRQRRDVDADGDLRQQAEDGLGTPAQVGGEHQSCRRLARTPVR
jgi:hypothetical protein